MKAFPALLVAGLLPAHAMAGAQYSAEDIIRYFEQANAAAAAPAHSVARTAPAASRGIVIGEPAPQGVVIGNPPAAGEAPLVIPMTGAKAGYTVPPAAAIATAPSASEAAPEAAPPGYDLMVTFEIDSATLTAQARQNLDAFARALQSPRLSGVRFAVEGHTDASGSAEHNLTLSEARAASVVSYLVEHGIEPARLSAAGFGETRPRLPDAQHPENRRVETRPLY